MTDTAAFLAGCAVTGVAALFLLRNDLTASQARGLSTAPIAQATAQAPAPTPSNLFQDPGQEWKMQTQLEQQQGASRELADQFRKQQGDTEDIKNQLEKQQTQTEDLRGQLEKQQRSTEQLLIQVQEQQHMLEKMADRQQIEPAMLRSDSASSGQIQTTFLWIAGGVFAVILVGGGLMLIGVIAVVLLSSRRRQTRTVHVVHPVPTPYNFAEQPQLLPPMRPRIKPPKQMDYYDE